MSWRSMPKVCKPRHGQANSKAYRRVSVMQPPTPARGDWPAMGACCLGTLDYAGPMRSTHYMEHGKLHVLEGCHLYAWWHCGAIGM